MNRAIRLEEKQTPCQKEKGRMPEKICVHISIETVDDQRWGGAACFPSRVANVETVTDRYEDLKETMEKEKALGAHHIRYTIELEYGAVKVSLSSYRSYRDAIHAALAVLWDAVAIYEARQEVEDRFLKEVYS